MINISIVELVPSLFLEEDEEEQEPEGYHGDMQGFPKDAEPEGALEVYAERNHYSVCYECPMHPTEAVG